MTHDVTDLLHEWRNGDAAALEQLIPLVYADLRRLARRYLRQEKHRQTIETSALVHEAYLRLVRCGGVAWQDRAHFFGVAAKLMRDVLVETARKRASGKRGGGLTRVPIAETMVAVAERQIDLVALDRALQKLESIAPRKCEVVEMRFFGGMTIEETAEVLGVSIDIVKREWRTAKLWLAREVTGAEDGIGTLG
jgi:RNA polymerase sigma factor (TIGR02999 family)